MNLTVFTGPDSSANLTELFKRTPLRRGPICAVVPDAHSVTAMQKWLAGLTGDAFLGHRVYTFESITREILSLDGNPPGVIRGYIKRAILAEIVKSRIGAQSNFFSISSYPGFISLLVSFLEEVRSRSDGRVSGEPDLVSIAAAYESHLARLGYNDHEGLVTSALEGDRIERFSASFQGSLIVDGFYDLTGKQFELLERLIRCFSRCSITVVNDPVRPLLFNIPAELLLRYQSIGARICEVKPDSLPTAGKVFSGFMGGNYPSRGEPEDVQIHTFRSDISEAEWIAGTIRSLLAGGTCEPGDIMVVSRYPHGFASSLEVALRIFDIPVQGGFARALITCPVVRLALNALEASIYPDKEEILSGVQKSSYTGDMQTEERYPLEGFDDRGWSCMIADVDSPEGYVTSLKNMLEVLGVRGNLDGMGNREQALSETASFVRLRKLLDEFAEIYSPFNKMMRANEFQRLLLQFLGRVAIPDSPPPAGGVMVVDVNHARYIRRDVVFLTGLDDSSFPARDLHYSLHDGDIARELRAHREAEEPLLFYMASQGAQQLFLTFPGIDDEGSDNAMSPYLREIQEAISPWVSPDFHARVAGAGWEGGAPRRRGQSEQLIRMMKKYHAHMPSILNTAAMHDMSLKQHITDGIKTLVNGADRRGCFLSSHPSFEIARGEWDADRVFPVTDLEAYLSCPYKFFLARLLGLSVDVRIPGDLDPATRGLIIHDILAKFYLMRIQRTGKSGLTRGEFSESKTLMRSIVNDVFAKAVRNLSGIHPVVLLAEKKFIHTWMERFLLNEAEYFEDDPFEPYAFEIEFGRAHRDEQAHYPPLTLDSVDEQVMVGGRIDRIDVTEQDGTHYIRVIDYKTGAVDTSLSRLREGTVLQIPLYLAAAIQSILPGSRIHDGMYYSLREMELKKYKVGKHPVTGSDWEEFISRACSQAVYAAGEIRTGDFPFPEKGCDEYCEFFHLCRFDNAENNER